MLNFSMIIRLWILLFPVLLCAADKSFEEGVLKACECFAANLVHSVFVGNITVQQAMQYIEDPAKGPKAPDFVYKFYSQSFFTPVNV